MNPTLVALCFILAVIAFVVAVLLAGPDRWRAPLTWIAAGLALWLLPAVWNAVEAA